MAEWPPSPGCSPLAGYSPLAEYPPLAERSPLPGRPALAGTAGPAAPRGRPPDAPAAVAPPLHKRRQKYQDTGTRQNLQARPASESTEPRLTLGAALGAAPRSSARVRQAWLRRVPSCRGGRVFRDLDHRRLGFLRHALNQGPEIKATNEISINNNQDETREGVRSWILTPDPPRRPRSRRRSHTPPGARRHEERKTKIPSRASWSLGLGAAKTQPLW